jgi:CRP-like cAMP-binding protein
MRQLADIAQTVTLKAGTPLFAESAAAALWVILAGEVTIRESAIAEKPLATARAGDVIGAINTMAGRPLGVAADVVKGGAALRLDREDLFALLGERPELLRQMFSGLFRGEMAVTR